MRRLIALLAFLPLATQAANLPTKAPPAPLGYPTKCGMYFGLNAEAGAGTTQGAAVGVTVIGGDVGGLVGYACNSGIAPWFVEGIADFQNLNGATNGFALSGPIHLEQRAGIQTPLFQFLPFFGVNTGTPTLPVLPPGVTVSGPAQNYIYGAVDEDDISAQFGVHSARDWLISPEFGTGMLVPVNTSSGTPLVVDAYAGVELQSSSMCLGTGGCPKLNTRYKTGFSVKF